MPLSLITTVCHNMMYTPCAILSNLKDSVNSKRYGQPLSFTAFVRKHFIADVQRISWIRHIHNKSIPNMHGCLSQASE